MLDFAKDKKFWENVRESDDFAQHRAELLALYESAFKQRPRAHSAKDILENNDHGLWRLQFDHLQSSALLSLIYPENEQYYNDLIDTVWAYLDDYAWAPLGHYTEQYYGKTPKDFDNGLIDIFASSVGFALCEVKNLFEDRFPQLLKDRISHEVRRHIIEPYCERGYFWETHDNNWTAVCTSGVACAMMYEAPELFFEHQARIHASMECYLASYKDDGMCVEGIGYWQFGFGFFSAYAMLERELTGGKVDWFAREKVKEISKNLQKVFLQRDVIVTFSDCSIIQKYHMGLPHMLRHIYGDMIEPLPITMGRVVEDNTHFNFALRAFIYFNKSNITDSVRENVTYCAKNSCYLTRRTSKYGFATKGGNNGESHNHIDVGSFILASDNRQIICDIGAGPYEDGYHTNRRYTFFNPSSYAHNIPIIDGIGEDDIAREDVIVKYDEDTSSAKMELACAYGRDYIKSVKREFDFTDSAITMRDSFDLDKECKITERFVSVIEPVLDGATLKIHNVKITVEGEISPQVSVKMAKHHISGEEYPVYLIDYELPQDKSDFEIKFEVE